MQLLEFGEDAGVDEILLRRIGPDKAGEVAEKRERRGIDVVQVADEDGGFASLLGSDDSRSIHDYRLFIRAGEDAEVGDIPHCPITELRPRYQRLGDRGKMKLLLFGIDFNSGADWCIRGIGAAALGNPVPNEQIAGVRFLQALPPAVSDPHGGFGEQQTIFRREDRRSPAEVFPNQSERIEGRIKPSQ